MGAFALIVGSTVTGFGGSTSTGTPAWAANPRLDAAGDLIVRLSNGSLNGKYSGPGNSGTSCAAESSSTGNVQVNCLKEDGSSAQNTQSETSVSAFGQKVVVGYNDSLVCCVPALNFTGYSVSNDGGKSFIDAGGTGVNEGVSTGSKR